LIPREVNALAVFEQAASVETAYFDSPALTILYERFVAKQVFCVIDGTPQLDSSACRYYGRQEDQAEYQKAIKKIETVLDVYETILGHRKYLASDVYFLSALLSVSIAQSSFRISPWLTSSTFRWGKHCIWLLRI
jgi:glutathione S-transferase